MSDPLALPGRPGEPDLVLLDDAEAVAAEGARRVAEALRAAVERRGRADIALTGGVTVGALYRCLATPPIREAVPWPAVHLWWGDDRFVGSEHPESSVFLARTTLFAGGSGDAGDPTGLGLPTGNVHPFPIDVALAEGHDAAWVADAYAAELRGALPTGPSGRPAFDVALLSIGADGHVLSVFPGSAAFARDAPLVLAVPAPAHIGPHLPRLTLRPDVLDDAAALLVLAVSPAKSAAIAAALGPERDPVRWPAQVARRRGATWLVDRACLAAVSSPEGRSSPARP